VEYALMIVILQHKPALEEIAALIVKYVEQIHAVQQVHSVVMQLKEFAAQAEHKHVFKASVALLTTHAITDVVLMAKNAVITAQASAVQVIFAAVLRLMALVVFLLLFVLNLSHLIRQSRAVAEVIISSVVQMAAAVHYHLQHAAQF
jgi:hypothetical protein